ncbi:MAG: hypothetical protein AAF468_05130 [Pseudomonadota bacterium]
MRKFILVAAVIGAGTAVSFAANEASHVVNEFEAGSVSKEDGLTNWQKFYEVASHPRCSNCHAPNDTPMWSGPSYGKARPHGMNINAGASRIGAEGLPCGTCHTAPYEGEANPNAIPHAAPRVASGWQLAPRGAAWFGRTSDYVCQQLRDPARNGNMTIKEIAGHLGHDKILRWAWNPGGGREPAPYSLQETMDNLMRWAAAGTPCPSE